MTRPDQEAIDTFMSITGVSEATAIRKLEEHRGNLNEAVDAYFSEGDRNQIQAAPLNAPQDDVMDVDDPIPFESHRPLSSLLPFVRDLNPFSLLNPNFTRNLFDSGNAATRSPFISHPREVREIPIEVKDEIGVSGHPGGAPTIEDVTETVHVHGPEVRGTVIIDEDDDDHDDNKGFPDPLVTHAGGLGSRDSSTNSGPGSPIIMDVLDYENDIEEEMLRAAIEASKQDAAMSNQQSDEHLDLRDSAHDPGHSYLEDASLAHAVSLSLQAAEQEKVLRELEGKVGASEVEGLKSAAPQRMEKLPSNGWQSRAEVGNTSMEDEAEDVEELPLVRHRRRCVSTGPISTAKNIEDIEVAPPSSPRRHDSIHHLQHDESDFPSDEWGGISSEEHDEALMLEAAMFGGIPDGGGHPFPHASHELMQNDLGTYMGHFSRHIARPPSPSLAAQRLIREQQDDEYLASLQADREKELKAKEEAEAAERRKEDELRGKLQEEQETERQLAAKEASLPQEPTPDDENAVTLLVRMPDGSRRGRRFLKSDKLQCLFDFIDVGRAVKPGSYRVVRPYPRRAFSDGESTSTLHELGLTSKQEALYLEFM
ncbi:Plant UBX domain-containing protein 8 [Sesamum alatum]|uniref:Plant UBX domain-containing protein 8 n=1 Tax=Sesamum alatum TaxID=300844 RepID=A0AAE1Y387_9LAMI|nr:Plant UBX domain-containing protein 8 [Sesamum alatum]